MKNSTFFWAQLLILFLVIPARAEWVTINIVVDNVVIGETPVAVAPLGKVTDINGVGLMALLEPFVLEEKTKRIQKLLKSDKSLSIEDLERVGINSVFSERDLQLILTIPNDMRSVKDFPLAIKRTKAGLSLYNKDYSGYFNFSVLAGFSAVSMPSTYINKAEPKEGRFEFVQNMSYFTFETTANYKEFDLKPFQRLETSLVHDFEYTQSRLRVGDFFTGIQAFQSSLPSAGIQYKKHFNIYPERGSLSKRSTIINVRKSSLMEVYVNGILITRFRVIPGPYNLKELPVLYGRNRVMVILIDDFGGREEFQVDLFFDDQILAAGVHNYSYQAGVPSYYVLNEKLYDPRAFGSFFHQYGFNDQLTLGVNFQTYDSSKLAGLALGYLSDIGTNVFDFGFYSDDTAEIATAQKWRYGSPDISNSYLSGLRVLLGAELRSGLFKTITVKDPVLPTYSHRYDFILQKLIAASTSASISISKIVGQNGSPNDLARRIGFQSQFTRNWMFDLNYNWTEQQRYLDQILATLTWTETQGRSLASVSHNSPNNSTSIRLAKNNTRNYNDFRLSGFASKQAPRDAAASQQMDVAGDYFGRFFESRLRVFGDSSEAEVNTTAQVGFGSAFVWTVDGVAFSRHVSDSFAIISPNGLSDESKLSIPNGTEKDITYLKNDSDFVFSNLTSYHHNRLQFNSTELQVGHHLERESYVLIPKYRSGVYIPLVVQKAVILKGQLSSKVPEWHTYAYGKIWSADGQLHSSSFFTDENGKFIIEGLTPGKYEVELSDPRLNRIPIDVEEIEKTEIDLGIIPLEKKEGA